MSPPPRGLVLVALAASTTLLGGLALKNQCTYHDWADHYQYKHYCYSDILPLYWIRHLDRDAVPYLEEFSEYPVLTGAATWFIAGLTDSLHAYLLLTFFLLLACGYLTTVALWRLGLPWPRVLAWAASPALVIHGYTNWDLVAVALAAAGWLAWRRRQAFAAALLFGLGGAAKLYPAFFLPFLLVHATLARDRRAAGHVVAGGFLGLGVPNLAVAAAAPDNWWGIWRFHAGRFPDFETPWQAAIEPLGRRAWPTADWGEPWRDAVGAFVALALGALLVALLVRQWRHRIDPLAAGGVFTLAFLLLNLVYSPQYTLWALPILAALGARWAPLVGFTAADLANFWVRYRLFQPPAGQAEGWDLAWMPWSRTFVLARWLFLAWATIAIARAAWRPAAAGAQPDASAAPPERGDPDETT